MTKRFMRKLENVLLNRRFHLFLGLLFFLIILFFAFPDFFSSNASYQRDEPLRAEEEKGKKQKEKVIPPLDTVAYDKKLNEIANNPPPKEPTTKIEKDPETGEEKTVIVPPPPAPITGWPVHTVYPNAGAILPFNRIVAYYGNLYSKKMGVLGEYPEDVMLQKLKAEVQKWETADPFTPVVPALHYIAVVAQGSAGADGKYRFRMPDSEINKALAIAEKVPTSAGGNAIVFLDIQVGLSNLQTEVPYFEKYLKMPNVHLGVDPEFSMKTGARPGKVVGTLDASDINFTAEYLARLVRENNLPPKILVVHRYTQNMLTNYKLIKPLPEVQIVIHMDGWGEKAKKINTYRQFIYPEPVQFTGFKLFYKNDIFNPNTVLMTPADLLKLSPQPVYIQYQ